MKNPITSSILLFLVMLVLNSCGSKPEIPTQLRCEYQENPVGLDVKAPRFSWAMGDTVRGAAQTAFRIMVASSEANLNKNISDVWDSRIQKTDQSQFIEYKGPALQSVRRYYWKVRIWNQKGKASAWSPGRFFETGILDQKEWKARWIAARWEKDEFPPKSVLMRSEFELAGKVEEAKIYVTGLGNYVFYLNGKKVGNDLLSPGWTDYRQKVQYQVYDVTSLLKTGRNAMGAILGNMWWSSGLGWQGGATYSKGPLRLLAQLMVTFGNGTTSLFVTDSSWKFTRSPVLYNHIYHGETYDARLEIPAWNEPSLNETGWKSVVLVDTMKLKLVSQQDPPIRVSQKITPITITEPGKGIYVFDLGQNMVGRVRLKAKGEAGRKIELRFAELLHPDGTVAQENLRKSKATDVYIMKGQGIETWEPQFTYHGFRYVQVTGLSEKPDQSTITGIVFHSSAPVTGHFACSNELLNKIYKNITWGQRGNMMSVPTDCPQRDERLGWMGDAQIFAPTASYSMNMNQFFAKWETDITDCQDNSGFVYNVNPAIVVGGPAKPGWGDAVVIIPWHMYNFYGDARIIKDHYDGMKKWINYMRNNSNNFIYEFGKTSWGGYGDWVPVDTSPTKPIGTAYYYYCSLLLSKMAKILGDTAGSKDLLAQSVKIAQAYQKKYFIDSLKNYKGLTQTANVLPFEFGITPENLKEAVLHNVIKNIQDKKDHLSTGFLGTAYLLPMLSDNGYHELAYKVASQKTYPSWGYMVEKGATTMWELWNSDTEPPDKMNSRNHFAYGSVGAWYFGYLAGIRPDPEYPGFRHSIIAPMPAGDLTWAEAFLLTGYGLLSSWWDKKGNNFMLKVNIPANTWATVILPMQEGRKTEISESGRLLFSRGKPASKDRNITYNSQSKGGIAFEVKSGTYYFKLTSH